MHTKIPLIGLGTWQLRGRECTQIVRTALEMGYQHIDTAHVYENHKAIKKAIAGFDRNKLFLTSKLSLEQVDQDRIDVSVEKACNLALKELGIDFLDLYLIHWPDRAMPLSRIFQAMHRLKERGKIKEAGVSNFTIHHLQDLLQGEKRPFANQVEFHPYLYQKELLDYCQSNQIELISYRPLGKGKLLEEPLFAKIGQYHQKTGAQIILRWLIQKNIPVIPKASSKRHLQENLEIFDFSLTEQEMHQLDHLNKNIRFCGADSTEFDY